MDWQEGSERLVNLSLTGFCASMVQGDILNMMFEGLAEEMAALKKKNKAAWQDMGGAHWRRVAQGQAAQILGSGIRMIMKLRQVSATFGPDIVPRLPDAPNAFQGHWSYLDAACRFADPWRAVQYGMAQGWGVWEFKHATQVGDQYVIEEPKPVKRNTKGRVKCPHCGSVFAVDDEGADERPAAEQRWGV